MYTHIVYWKGVTYDLVAGESYPTPHKGERFCKSFIEAHQIFKEKKEELDRIFDAAKDGERYTISLCELKTIRRISR